MLRAVVVKAEGVAHSLHRDRLLSLSIDGEVIDSHILFHLRGKHLLESPDAWIIVRSV